MTTIKYPSVIRPFETLVFGVPAIAISLISFIEIVKYGSTMPAGAIPLLIVVSVLFVGCYVASLVLRAMFIGQFDYMSNDGILFCMRDRKTGESYDVKPSEVSAMIDDVINAYEPFVRSPRSMIQSDYVYVFMHFGPIDEPELFGPHRKAGYTVAPGNIVHASFMNPTQPIGNTAVPHELGHVILGRAWNDWDCKKHHDFMNSHNLP